MNRHAVFRADASLTIGTGHVMRCLTLADALAERGVRSRFVCREHPGHLLGLVRDRGHDALALPAPRPDPALAGYAAWLGTGWEQDAAETRAGLADRPADLLVVDHYALDARWEQALAGAARWRMAIDDLADRPHAVDLLLDQNLGRRAADYAGRVPPGAELMIGPRHALLRPAFAAHRAAALARRDAGRLERVLVSLGGVDAQDATSRVLRALAGAPCAPGLQVTVVMGPTAPWLSRVRELAAAMPCPTRVLSGVPDLAAEMTDADLAIGAAGSTSWERCCLGLPTLMVVLADNQREAAARLAADGAAVGLTLDDGFEPALERELQRLAADPASLSRMAADAARVTDGLGAARVGDRIALLWSRDDA